MGEPDRTIILPGLDGTGRLLSEFVAAAPDPSRVDVLIYDDSKADYSQLVEEALESIRAECRIRLIGESFGGPITVRIAERIGERVQSLILVASFVTPPSWLARCLPWRLAFRMRPPGWALRRYLLDQRTAADSVAQLREVLRDLAPSTLARRMREVARVDERSTLARISAPVLYLRATRDRLVRESCTRPILEARQDALIAEIDAPHLLLQHAPQEAWRRILEFESRISA